jgi:hypothetical protein
MRLRGAAVGSLAPWPGSYRTRSRSPEQLLRGYWRFIQDSCQRRRQRRIEQSCSVLTSRALPFSTVLHLACASTFLPRCCETSFPHDVTLRGGTLTRLLNPELQLCPRCASVSETKCTKTENTPKTTFTPAHLRGITAAHSPQCARPVSGPPLRRAGLPALLAQRSFRAHSS